MPKPFDVPMLIEKYTGKRFGSWIVGDKFFKQNKHWNVNVKCDCGKTHNVTVSALALHKGCSCGYLDMVHRYKNKGYAATDLEKIWPDVVKAGRQAMEKYKDAMATI